MGTLMMSTRLPATGVDAAGDAASGTTLDIVSAECITSPRGNSADPPGEIGGVLPLSFGDPRQLLPGEGVSGPDVQLVTRAGDIHVELTVGDGDVHPPHEPAVTVDVDIWDGDDD